MTQIEATLTLAEAVDDQWDALVVGAGPAGAVAARGLALRGLSVLLVDKAEFPRWKICGCCLNGAAVATLGEIGLGTLPPALSAPRLNDVCLMAGGRKATVHLPEGYSLSRERLDYALIVEAIRAGAHFLPKIRAGWHAWREQGTEVGIDRADESAQIHARMVLAADGLAAGFTRHVPGVRCRQRRNARLGAGATFAPSDERITAGTIHMAIGRGGYVGMVRLEDDRLNVAAAFDPALVKAAGGLHEAACQVLKDAGADPLQDDVRSQWRGTPPLTRRYVLPDHGRLILLGDAAAYVEPFTGEGMAWALASGAAIAPIVAQVTNHSTFEWRTAWKQTQSDLLAARQWRCWVMASLLRHPRLVSLGVRALSAAPSLAKPYLYQLNRGGSLPV